MEKTRQNKLIRAGVLCLVLAIVTLALIMSTFAKYVTSGSFEDQARVAKWGINVSGGTSSLFDSAYRDTPDSSVTVEAENKKDHVVAPGTEKSVDLMLVSVTGKAPEVMYDFDVKLRITDATSGDASSSTIAKLDQLGGWHWWYSVDQHRSRTYLKTHAELEQAINALSKKNVPPNQLPGSWVVPNGISNITVGWVWNFDDDGKGTWDKEDTLLGNMAAKGELDNLKVDLNVSATQVLDKSSDVYTVSFDTQGGSKNPDPQFVKDGDFATQPIDPTKDHWQFSGWEDLTAGSSWQDFDDPVDHNMILEAQWDPATDPELKPIDVKPDDTWFLTPTDASEFSVSAVSPGLINVDSDNPDVQVVKKVVNDNKVTFSVNALKETEEPAVISVWIDPYEYYYMDEFSFSVDVTCKPIWHSGGEPKYDLVYDGTDQSLIETVVVDSPTAAEAPTKVQYAISDSSSVVPESLTWQSTVPTGKDATEDTHPYYVWYRIDTDPANPHYKNVMSNMIEVDIAKAESKIEAPDDQSFDSKYSENNVDKVFEGATGTVGNVTYSFDGTEPDDITIDSANLKLTLKAKANIQDTEFSIKAEDEGDKNHKSGNCTFNCQWEVSIDSHNKLKDYKWDEMLLAAKYLENLDLKDTDEYKDVKGHFENFVKNGIKADGKQDNATASIQDNHWGIDMNNKTSGDEGFDDSSATMEVRIIGILQDQKADGSGCAAFTFMSTHGYNGMQWHNQNKQPTYFPNATLFNNITSVAVPDKVKNSSVTIKKPSAISDEGSGVTNRNMKLFIPSAWEIGGDSWSYKDPKDEGHYNKEVDVNHPYYKNEGTGTEGDPTSSLNQQYFAFKYINYKYDGGWRDGETSSCLENINRLRGATGDAGITGVWTRSLSTYDDGEGTVCYAYKIMNTPSGKELPGRITRAVNATATNATICPCFCL